MKASKSTIIRTIVLIIALTNQILTASGKNPLPWSDTEIYEAVSVLFATILSIISWWKNNSFTKEAIEADEYKKTLKGQALV